MGTLSSLKTEYIPLVDTTEYTIPGSIQGVRLVTLIASLADGGSVTGDRWLDLYDTDASGEHMFRVFLQSSDDPPGTTHNDTAFDYVIKFPLQGMRFPGGIFFTADTDFATTLTFMYYG